MDLQLGGKKAIVLGGTRGIGRAIVEMFADEGVDVALCARNAQQVDATVAALESRGVRAYGEAVDMADGDALKSFVSRAASTLGGIDVLVSNASALVQGAGDDAWRAMFAVDTMGAVRGFDAARPHLEEAASRNGDAAFVIISSVSAAEASAGSAYGAMKAALIHYAKGLAREHAPKHIRCNVVSPGTILFEGGVWGNVKAQSPTFFEQMIARNPTGRMGTPEEIASAVLFLASPLSAFTTGINMIVDGAITSRANF
jgi:3-oxoacyl-[acyl-carrier protein] reductase